MENDKSIGSWWQTIPGLLTALAGILTAGAGLLAALHQAGILGTNEKTPTITQTSNGQTNNTPGETPNAISKATEPVKSDSGSQATTPPTGVGAQRYIVTFPAGSEVPFRTDRAALVYSILASQVEDRNTEKLFITFKVRVTSKGPMDEQYGGDFVRLLVDGVPRAPANRLDSTSLSGLVQPRSAEEGELVFEIPRTPKDLVLEIDQHGERARIPITLKKQG